MVNLKWNILTFLYCNLQNENWTYSHHLSEYLVSSLAVFLPQQMLSSTYFVSQQMWASQFLADADAFEKIWQWYTVTV